jgi:predicted DNA-binding transcriptional regulator YafY
MKFAEAIATLRLLGTRHEDALTIQQIIAKWNSQYTTQLQLRTAQRYLSELCAEGADGAALVEVDASAKEWRYYLRLSEMANWFMTEEAALYQVLSLQVLQSTFGEVGKKPVERQLDAAEHLTQEQLRTKRLRERVRIVPDGIGRLRAKIAVEILSSVMDALAGQQRLEIEYQAASGSVSRRDLSPLGLVAKDGTLYLLAVKGLSDQPIHYALHRMKSAEVKPFAAQIRADFKLDDYIRESHQLSHARDHKTEPVLIKFKVDPKWLHHFEERPLSETQTIKKSRQPGGWAKVEVHIPVTQMLVPFIASFGPGIEILEPVELRQEVGQWLQLAASRYAKDIA